MIGRGQLEMENIRKSSQWLLKAWTVASAIAEYT